MEPRGPVQVPAPLGPPVNAEDPSAPASTPHAGMGSRAESDTSVRSVRGSISDDGTDVFTGNKTPRVAETQSSTGVLGAPLGEGLGDLAPKQRN